MGQAHVGTAGIQPNLDDVIEEDISGNIAVFPVQLNDSSDRSGLNDANLVDCPAESPPRGIRSPQIQQPIEDRCVADSQAQARMLTACTDLDAGSAVVQARATFGLFDSNRVLGHRRRRTVETQVEFGGCVVGHVALECQVGKHDAAIRPLRQCPGLQRHLGAGRIDEPQGRQIADFTLG